MSDKYNPMCPAPMYKRIKDKTTGKWSRGIRPCGRVIVNPDLLCCTRTEHGEIIQRYLHATQLAKLSAMLTQAKDKHDKTRLRTLRDNFNTTIFTFLMAKDMESAIEDGKNLLEATLQTSTQAGNSTEKVKEDYGATVATAKKETSDIRKKLEFDSDDGESDEEVEELDQSEPAPSTPCQNIIGEQQFYLDELASIMNSMTVRDRINEIEKQQ
jgi:hypothetical protein